MAGKVRTLVRPWEHQCLTVQPDVCPGQDDYVYPRPCLVADLHAPHVNLCPFLYRFILQVGGSQYDVMTIDAMLQWLGSQDIHGAQWHALCLRKESKDTEAGARLRS